MAAVLSALLPGMLSALAGRFLAALLLLVGLVLTTALLLVLRVRLLVGTTLLLAGPRIGLTLLLVVPLLVRHRTSSENSRVLPYPPRNKGNTARPPLFPVPNASKIINSLRNKEK
jgi:hypothetical protein